MLLRSLILRATDGARANQTRKYLIRGKGGAALPRPFALKNAKMEVFQQLLGRLHAIFDR